MFNIIKNFIVENYLDDLKKEINLRKDIVNINDISFSEERQTCWMSNKDYTYMYGGKIMYPDNISKTVEKIRQIVKLNYSPLDVYGLPYNIDFDSVLINYYKNGNIGMRYHSDEIYDTWEEESVIISFGITRSIVFREINNYNNKTYIDLESGDLLYMKKGCQKIYQHRILKNKQI